MYRKRDDWMEAHIFPYMNKRNMATEELSVMEGCIRAA
jgi:hypothetical protein